MKKIVLLCLTAVAAIILSGCEQTNQPQTEVTETAINPNAPDGLLPERFSVSETEYVRFSQGNVQYYPARKEWRFGPRQWDVIGKANEKVAEDYNGWIDLFGWGTGDNPTKTSPNINDYLTQFTDWGENHFTNGGDAEGVWRTLPHSKWEYLLFKRKDAEKLYAFGSIEGVDGIFILPDNWNHLSTKYLIGYNYDHKSFNDNRLSLHRWKVEQWEEAGAVFLPVAGLRNHQTENGIEYANASCNYWCSDWYKEGDIFYAYRLECYDFKLSLAPMAFVAFGYPVRLVQYESK